MDQPAAQPANIQTEILIWLDSSGDVGPHGGLLEQHRDFDLYQGERQDQGHRWDCYSFVLGKSRKRDDLAKYLRHLIAHHQISSDSWLADVEFGTEIWAGKGEMRVSQFDVSIEQTLPIEG